MSRKLTLFQGVAVLMACLAIVVSAYAAYMAGARILHRRAVRAAIPQYIAGLEAQRDRLAQAIQQYHSQYGFYPPQHMTNGQGALFNPLYYELVGTRWNTNMQSFGLP